MASGALADLLSCPSEIEYEGQVYKLGPPTQLQQAQYGEWLVRRAREGVERDAATMSREWVDNEHTKITRDRAAGIYSWNGAVCVQALGTYDGGLQLFRMILKSHHPAMSDELSEKMFVARAKWIEEVVLREIDRDPKAVEEALRTMRLPTTTSNKSGTQKNTYTSYYKTRRSTKRKPKSKK